MDVDDMCDKNDAILLGNKLAPYLNGSLCPHKTPTNDGTCDNKAGEQIVRRLLRL